MICKKFLKINQLINSIQFNLFSNKPNKQIEYARKVRTFSKSSSEIKISNENLNDNDKTNIPSFISPKKLSKAEHTTNHSYRSVITSFPISRGYHLLEFKINFAEDFDNSLTIDFLIGVS